MSAADEARAEAARRYPMHNQASIWHEMHLAGFHAFLAGVDWQASRDAGEVSRLYAINEELAGQVQAAQATIAEALAVEPVGLAHWNMRRILRRAVTPTENGGNE